MLVTKAHSPGSRQGASKRLDALKCSNYGWITVIMKGRSSTEVQRCGAAVRCFGCRKIPSPSGRFGSSAAVAMIDAAMDSMCQHSKAFQHSSVSPKMRKIRRCASTPTLSACSNDFAEGGLEVYVAFRPFTEFGGALFARMPPSVKDSMLGLGIAHYMTVFRTPDGRLTQFDFGPQGGRDIHVSAGSLDSLLTQPDQPRRKGKRSVPGELREHQLTSLPSSFVYVGQSKLSLADIRSFNRIQPTHYELHRNDCRHYVNNLVRYTTGIDRASAVFVQQAFKQKHAEPRWSNSIFTLSHYLTDVTNWPRIKAAGQASMAAAAVLTGRATFARFRPVLPTLLSPARPTLALVPAAKARIARRPVCVAATGAVATCAATFKQAPALEGAFAMGARVTEGIKSAATGAIALGRQTAGGLQGSLTFAGNSAANVAGAATRGAAMTLQHRQFVKAQPQRLGLSLPSLQTLPSLRRKVLEKAVTIV